jgi:hypothetical protein
MARADTPIEPVEPQPLPDPTPGSPPMPGPIPTPGDPGPAPPTEPSPVGAAR